MIVEQSFNNVRAKILTPTSSDVNVVIFVSMERIKAKSNNIVFSQSTRLN